MPTRILAKDEELSLARDWLERGDEKARAALVAAYQPMIRKIARPYLRPGLTFEDLLQEGTMGFMHGLENFKPELGYSIGTLARFHIRSHIQLHVSEFVGIIRLPHSKNIKELISKCVARIRMEESESGNRMDSKRRAEICEENGFTLDDLEQYEMVMRPTKSIQPRVAEDDGESGLDIQDANASHDSDVLGDLSRDHAGAIIGRVMEGFPDRTRKILTMRYLGDDFVSLDKIAAEVGISRERVRRIERDALAEINRSLAEAGISDISDIL